MRWFKPNLRSSIYAIFTSNHASDPQDSQQEITIEQIREAMLVLMARVGEERFPQVTRRIRYATDVQALWYLRGDLMAVLASREGESAAREHIDAVTRMFREVLPEGLRSRPSPLSK